MVWCAVPGLCSNTAKGSNLNPYINYPIREDLMGTPSLKRFVDLCHAADLKVKLYFTTRELSNRCAELFALKALPEHEVLYGDGAGSNGEGGGGGDGGGAWLQEHLGGDYVRTSTRALPWSVAPALLGPSLGHATWAQSLSRTVSHTHAHTHTQHTSLSLSLVRRRWHGAPWGTLGSAA